MDACWWHDKGNDGFETGRHKRIKEAGRQHVKLGGMEGTNIQQVRNGKDE